MSVPNRFFILSVLCCALLAHGSSAFRAGVDTDGDGVPDGADNCVLIDNTDQRDSNSDGYGNVCDADLNNDGNVNFIDLGQFKDSFLDTGDLDADFNGDGVVNFLDLGTVKQFFLQPPGPSGLIPIIDVAPTSIDVGDVFVGNDGGASFTVSNAGYAPLSISNVSSNMSVFEVFPPASFVLMPGDPPRTVNIGFTPDAIQNYAGLISVESDAGLDPVVAVSLFGEGADPTPADPPDISVATAIEFGTVAESSAAVHTLVVSNHGEAALEVSALSLGTADYNAQFLIGGLPASIAGGGASSIVVTFAPPAATAGLLLTDTLSIASNDPDNPTVAVALSGFVGAPDPSINVPVVAASVSGNTITAGNCAALGGSVSFSSESLSSDTYIVRLSDGSGGIVATASAASPQGAADVPFAALAACGLSDGVVAVDVLVMRGAETLPTFPGTTAVKNTSPLAAPVLDPVDPVSTGSSVEVCGTSRESTTVKITGGASSVSVALDNMTTAFCLDVPLRSNQQNTLIASATDDLAPPPRPVATAAPVEVVQLTIEEIVIAEVGSEPLTEDEIAELVANGVIDIDDPSNYNVSTFTVVLTIGNLPVTISAPIAVPTGGGSGGTIIVGSTQSDPGCDTACATVIAVPTPDGGTLPGIIIIDGRIKTLKEFFQVTLAILNASSDYVLTDVAATLDVPGGLTPIAAGPGTDVGDANADGSLTSITLGTIDPLLTGYGQFIVRGDAIGVHDLAVDFNGFITEGGLANPFPFAGAVSTDVEVKGPPELGVTVHHPSSVSAGQIYALTVDIINLSEVPALYTSLDLSVGADAFLVDEFGAPLAGSSATRQFGTIAPGATVSASFSVQSLITGDVIACQAVASDNVSLSVDTGVAGDACLVDNQTPSDSQPPDPNGPPTIFALSPQSGSGDVSADTAVFAILTPESACLSADTWLNVQTQPIDGDPVNGFEIIGADLDVAGTFYLEELDPFGNPVAHVPVTIDIENPVGGDTTIATLSPGLGDPVAQLALKPETTYRATLTGADLAPGSAVCNATTGAKLPSTVRWSFTTERDCATVVAPTVALASPADGGADVPLNQSIVVDFGGNLDLASVVFDAASIAGSTFGVYADAIVSGGDITSGTVVTGSGAFGNANQTLTYSPSPLLPEDTTIHLRFTDGIADTCGNPLNVPGGLQLFSFTTVAADTTAPDQPLVNPVPVATNQSSSLVSGAAEASSIVTVTGGVNPVSVSASSSSGLFAVSVALAADQSNALAVTAEDASGNVSPAAFDDINGDPLVVFYDATAPMVASILPPDGALDVPREATVSVTFDESIDAGTVNSLNFALEKQGGTGLPGSFVLDGTSGFTFTPDESLEYNGTYTVRVRANGVRDLVGNGLAADFVSTFASPPWPVPALSLLTPDEGAQGETLDVVFTGTDLESAQGVISDDPGIAGIITDITPTQVTASISIEPSVATGATTLGLTTLGGSASLAFTVLDPPPEVTVISPTVGVRGKTVDAAILGSGLSNVSDVSIDGAGVTVIDLGTGDSAQRDIQLVIASDADFGPRTITVTTPAGMDTGTFTVADLDNPPTIEWINPVGGNWTDGANWSTGVIPVATDDVLIATSSPVTLTGTQTVRTLALFSDLSVNGTLNAGDGLAVPALNVAAGSAVILEENATLTNTGGIALDGTVRLRDNSGGFGLFARLRLSGSQVVSGSGQILFEQTGSAGVNFVEAVDGGTAVIAAGITVSGGSGTLGGPDGTLAFNGTLDPSNGGAMVLTGVIDGLAGAMAVNPGIGEVLLGAGLTLRNAVVNGAGLLTARVDNATLENLTLNASLINERDATLTVIGGMTLNGTMTLADTSGSFANFAEVFFSGTQTLDGNGEIVFAGGGATLNLVQPTDGGTLSIGPGITVRGGNGTFAGPDGVIAFSGTIVPDLVGANIDLAGTLDGGGAMTVDAGDGDLLFVNGAIRNVTIDGTGEIVGRGLNGALENVTLNANLRLERDSIVTVTGGMTLNGEVHFQDNSGSFNLYSILRLDGTQTLDGNGALVFDGFGATLNFIEPEGFGTVTIGGGIEVNGGGGTLGGPNGTLAFNGTVLPNIVASEIRLAGEIDSAGGSMSVLNGAGDFRIATGAALRNVTVDGDGEIVGRDEDAAFENVTLNADLRLERNSTVTVTNGLNVNGEIRFQDNSDSFGDHAIVQLDGTQFLGGTGELVFDNFGAGFNFVRPIGAGTVTVGSGITVRGGGGTIGGPDGILKFRGAVHPDTPGNEIRLAGEIDSAGGSMDVLAGGGDFLISLGSAFRDVTIDGDGEIVGRGNDAAFENVVLNADLRLERDSIVTVTNGMTWNGDLTLQDTSSSFGKLSIVRFDGTQTVSGTGQIIYDSTASTTFNVVEPINAGVVTMSGGITVRGGGGTFGGAGGSFVFDGTFDPDRENLRLDLAGTIDGGGGTITVLPGTGLLRLANVTLANATVGGSGEMRGLDGDATFDGLTLDADLRLEANAHITVLGNLKVNGLLRMQDLSFSFGNIAALRFSGIQTLDGDGEILIEGGATNVNVIEATDAGTLTIGPGITIHGDGGTVGTANGAVVNLGTIDADTAGTILLSPTSFDNQGTIGARNAASVNVNNLLATNGVIRAGVDGIVDINGDLTLLPGASVELEIAGPTTDDLGFVDVSGIATLDGTLDIQLDGGYTPLPGANFRFMSFGSRSGSFGIIQGSDAGGGNTFVLDDTDPTDLELNVQ